MKIVSCQAFVSGAVSGRLIDVRSEAEFTAGHITGAELLPLSLISLLSAERFPHKDESLLLYCASGARAIVAAKQLEQQGYTNVSVLEGGYGTWCELQS